MLPWVPNVHADDTSANGPFVRAATVAQDSHNDAAAFAPVPLYSRAPASNFVRASDANAQNPFLSDTASRESLAGPSSVSPDDR